MRLFCRPWWVTLWVCVAIFAAGNVYGGAADRLILHPTTHPIPTAGLTQLLIGPEDQPVEVWQMLPARGIQTQGYVITFNGNADRAESAIKRFRWMWKDLPVEVWAVNFPGYGGSAGKGELAEITPAALAVYDHLKKQAGDKPIIVDGNSIGTTAALSLASQRPVDFVTLTHPPALKPMIINENGWWNLGVLAGTVAAGVPADLDSLATAPKCTMPALMLISDGDTVVPVKYQKLVAKAYKGKAQVMKIPGNHNDTPSAATQRKVQAKIKLLWTQAIKSHAKQATPISPATVPATQTDEEPEDSPA